MNLIGLDPVSLLVTAATVFTAGVIRGFSGFGFAMVAVTGMSLVLPPVQVVPAVLILDVLASLQLIPSIRRQIDWPSLRRLLAGALLATPAGVYVLATLPPAPMRVCISLAVLAAAVLLMRGWGWKRMPGAGFTAAVGAASGLLNGAAAIGGPPVILFYLSSPAGVAVSRASMIAFFLGLDILSLATAATQGLATATTFRLMLVAAIPLVLGIAAGSRLFARFGQAAFRRGVLILLMMLAAAGLLRALWG
jgi:uncharacterized membrane protein YfcA